jgi:TDG/mug DNA glycosylase family protein
VYQERTNLFKERGVVLWDVLAECEMRESRGHSIVEAIPNDLAGFLGRHPSIGHVFLNGRRAWSFYSRPIGDTLSSTPPVTVLPSSSPANVMRREDKVMAWMAVREALARG